MGTSSTNDYLIDLRRKVQLVKKAHTQKLQTLYLEISQVLVRVPPLRTALENDHYLLEMANSINHLKSQIKINPRVLISQKTKATMCRLPLSQI